MRRENNKLYSIFVNGLASIHILRNSDKVTKNSEWKKTKTIKFNNNTKMDDEHLTFEKHFIFDFQFVSDDLFLLQFLRAKKYVMDNVFLSFENYVHAQKKYSKWFDMSEEDNKRMIELYRTGYAYPLAERDEEGRRVIFIQLRNIDPDYFTSSDAIRLTSVISTALMEEEETRKNNEISLKISQKLKELNLLQKFVESHQSSIMRV